MWSRRLISIRPPITIALPIWRRELPPIDDRIGPLIASTRRDVETALHSEMGQSRIDPMNTREHLTQFLARSEQAPKQKEQGGRCE
jgi:hypothetical protein